MFNRIVFAIGLALLCVNTHAGPVHTASATVELISDTQTIVPGVAFRVGVRIRMDPEWHVYWVNPGEAGMPTRVTLTLPPGFEVGELQWPYPKWFVSDGIVGFGYEDEVILFSEIMPPSSLEPGSEISLEAEVEMLLCKEICVPGFAGLERSFHVTEQLLRDEKGGKSIDQAASLLPVSVSEDRVSARYQDGSIVLRIDPSEGLVHATPVFFPEARNLLAVDKDVVWIERDGAMEGRFTLSHLARGTPFRLRGVLVWQSESSTEAWQVDGRLMR